jgi:hypothetical protein
MNPFHIPGFTADASLYKARKHYGARTSNLTGAEASIFPQAKKVIGHGPGKLDSICKQVGDLINEMEDMADDAAKNGDVEGFKESLALIREYNRRSGQWGCTFS